MQESIRREMLAQINTNRLRLVDMGADQKEMMANIESLKNKVCTFVKIDELDDVKKKMKDFAPVFRVDKLEKQLMMFTTLAQTEKLE